MDENYAHFSPDVERVQMKNTLPQDLPILDDFHYDYWPCCTGNCISVCFDHNTFFASLLCRMVYHVWCTRNVNTFLEGLISSHRTGHTLTSRAHGRISICHTI